LMGEIELDAERQLMNRFLEELVRAHPKATYGEMMIKKALDMGAVDTLLISEGMRKNSVHLQCNSCGNEWNVSLTRSQELPSCPQCDAKGDDIKELGSISLIDELSIMAGKGNSELSFISTDTEEGSQLMHGFGGLAAILRYPVM
ncbi:MAG: peptide chain release factor 1, partial [Candidatus Thermoplasmatota archaeon]|nr:peptide chain release factor 1 [Candidatus Thermoplasmatota archaeon]